MKKILLLICAISFFSANLVSAAHAHVEKQGSDQSIELSIDNDISDNENVSDKLCDIHCHNHIANPNILGVSFSKITNKPTFTSSKNIDYSLIYGLNRPPRI